MNNLNSFKHLFGLIGYPLTHSFSQQYFNDWFKKEQLADHHYANFSIESISDLPDIIEDYPNLKGLNVTIPYKEQVILYLNKLSPEAQEIGAVNVISKTAKGLEGHNSDIYGFQQSLLPLLQPTDKRALILGTGGASKAVVYVLNRLGLDFQYVSRNPAANQVGYTQVPDIIHDFQLIINTTPLGTYPKVDTCPDLPYDKINSNYLLYDLVYNPAETVFLSQGKIRGARIKNGLEMLILQAKRAWHIWHKTD